MPIPSQVQRTQLNLQYILNHCKVSLLLAYSLNTLIKTEKFTLKPYRRNAKQTFFLV